MADDAHLAAVLGQALRRCLPDVTGHTPGGMSETAACDKAAADQLVPVVKALLAMRKNILLQHMYDHEIEVRYNDCFCICGRWQSERGLNVRSKHAAHVVEEFFNEE